WTNDLQLPFGWEERVRPHTKETFFYDTKTGKIHNTLPGTTLLERKGGPFRIRMRFRHILIKHEESETRESYRERRVVRTKAEALEKITFIRNLIKEGRVKFAKAAAKHSDCCSARRGGDFGPIMVGETNEKFEMVATMLELYELSEIFETSAGYHVALRIP
ncbi:hypothetical protein KR074_006971, partial [Drosophila pseudoananassae]